MGLLNIMKPERGLFEDAGDRWMRSLNVSFLCCDESIEIDGYRFEEMMLALGLRHLAVHPRSRDIVPGSMPADRLSAIIERNWSSIDSYGLNEMALKVQSICRRGDIEWRLS